MSKHQTKHTSRILHCLTAAAMLLAMFAASGCENFLIINEVYTPDTNISADSGEDTTDQVNYETAAKPVTSVNAAEEYKKQADAYLNGLRKDDFDGSSFIITSPDLETIAPSVVDSETSAARLKRNDQIEAKYNLTIVPLLEEESVIFESTKNAYNADSYYSDLITIPIERIGAYAAEGILMNINSLPYLDLKVPYIYEEATNAFSGGFNTFAVTGEALFNPNSLHGMFFNKDAMTAAGIELPYGAAYDKNWAWDSFFEILTKANGYLDENSMYTTGTSLDQRTTAAVIFKSTGLSYVSSRAGVLPMLAFNTDNAAKAAEIIRKFTGDGYSYFNAPNSETADVTFFHTGGTLFHLDRLYIMPWLTNSTVNWGLVPIPTEDAGDDYKSLVSSDSLVFAVPGNNTAVAKVALIIQALNAASDSHITQHFIDYHMNYVLRDNDSINMLDTIIHSRTYDFAYAFGKVYGHLSNATYKLTAEIAGGASLESLYKKYAAAAQDQLNDAFPLSHN